VIGKDADAVSLPVNFMRFNEARGPTPYAAGCTRTAEEWKPSFAEAPQLLPLRKGNAPPRY
ncbi:MAG TPA: hypothetical protein VHT04_04555, partial [Stellaceae bacterium]|nr:hypothetical protein [Stellaceae bacterium]